MNFPCPHFGSDESFYDRSTNEIKPIIPVELQGNFEEPPPLDISPNLTSNYIRMKPVSKPLKTQVSSNLGFSIQEQIQSLSIVDYKFESSPARTPRLGNMKKAIKTIEKEIKTLSSDM